MKLFVELFFAVTVAFDRHDFKKTLIDVTEGRTLIDVLIGSPQGVHFVMRLRFRLLPQPALADIAGSSALCAGDCREVMRRQNVGYPSGESSRTLAWPCP